MEFAEEFSVWSTSRKNDSNMAVPSKEMVSFYLSVLKVGSWTPGKGLSLEREDLTLPGGSGFVSVCPNAAKCDVCFPDPSTALQSRCGLLLQSAYVVILVLLDRSIRMRA